MYQGSITRLRALEESLHAEVPASQAAPEPGHTGFGMRNVDMRIRLYYRQEEGLRIDADDTGTTVSFDVPVLTKEELEHDQGISG